MKTTFLIFFLFLGIIIHVNAQIPTNGLVGYWPLNGNANDESGNGNNGIVTGATLTSDRTGRPNMAYNFDGFEYITTDFEGILGSNDRTISFWLKVDPSDSGGYVLSYGGLTGGTTFTPGVWTSNNVAHLDVNNATIGYNISDINDGIWHNYIYVFSTTYGTTISTGVKIYMDGVELTDLYGSYNPGTTINTGSDYTLYLGNPDFDCYYSLDDVRVYDRVLTESEMLEIVYEQFCADTTMSDTTAYFVSSPEFEGISPRVYFEEIDSLTSTIGDCDSIIFRYSKYVFQPNYYTDTTWVYDTIRVEVIDTTYITETEYITVTDTLIIDVTITGIDPPDNFNTIKVYPNPTKDAIYINTGKNYDQMADYKIRIVSSVGALIFESSVTDPLFEIKTYAFGEKGLYLMHIIDASDQIIDTRKIILE